MKRILLTALALLGMTMLNTASGGEETSSPAMQHHAMDMADHHHAMDMTDHRISLNMPPPMKLHQLSNMREHLTAVQSIIRLLSENKFEDAAGIAHTKLGLTPEMQKMCSMFGDERFRELGFAFHRSGDELGEALKTRNMQASLRALDKTMAYCAKCHASFRQ